MIERIKAEIDRLQNDAIAHGRCYCEYEKGYLQGKKDTHAKLLDFIESIEKEPSTPLSTVSVPRWVLEHIEDTLNIQNNINGKEVKETGETCQDRNIKESLNELRKLLKGEKLSGLERLEILQPELPESPTVMWSEKAYKKGYEQVDEDILVIIQKCHDKYKSILEKIDNPRSRTARDLISRMREDSRIIKILKEKGNPTALCH